MFALEKISRRIFLKISVVFTLIMMKARFGFTKISQRVSDLMPLSESNQNSKKNTLHRDSISNVYISRGRSPEDNVKNVINLFGGIEKIINNDDIVILKPNAQWWNQGTTNTNNMKGFIELVLNIPEFKGEIIIAENHHYKTLDSRGWTTNERNGDYNLNELIEYFNNAGYKNVSKYHWVDGGPNLKPQEGDGGGGNIVSSVEEGDGYIWLKNNVYVSPEKRKCMMTYPVFTSVYSGKKIDLKRGTLENGKYLQNVKLVNFSCLNHHSSSFGVTASIKNLMGVVDLTCGYHGSNPEGFYNVHFIGKMSSLYQAGIDLKYYSKRLGFGSTLAKEIQGMGYWSTLYTGGALGHWLKTVKMPDLNILAAEYVGWGGRGRNGPDKRSRTNAVAISTDPVALDYIGAKKILLPATPKNEKVYRDLNDPDNVPFRLFLEECHKQGIGNLNKEKIEVIEA